MLYTSLEPSRQDGSNSGSQNMFYGEIWVIIRTLSLLTLLIWSTANIIYALLKWVKAVTMTKSSCTHASIKFYVVNVHSELFLHT